VIELSSIEAILAFVADGFGATILPEFSVSEAWRKRLVVRGAGRAIKPLAVRSCARRGHAPSRAAAAFLELVRAPAPRPRG
jgi:DNA-binding transcriptional LysR family regulator